MWGQITLTLREGPRRCRSDGGRCPALSRSCRPTRGLNRRRLFLTRRSPCRRPSRRRLRSPPPRALLTGRQPLTPPSLSRLGLLVFDFFPTCSRRRSRPRSSSVTSSESSATRSVVEHPEGGSGRRGRGSRLERPGRSDFFGSAVFLVFISSRLSSCRSSQFSFRRRALSAPDPPPSPYPAKSTCPRDVRPPRSPPPPCRRRKS